ncbi:MAG: YccS family putative transporter [Burkholderiaceae bacterium]
MARFWRQGWKQESVASSLRVLLALTPVMASCWLLDRGGAALPALLGVIASALAETDDAWRGRLRVQLLTLAGFALVATAIQLSLDHPPLPGLVMALAAIVLTLLGALGRRYRAMASATLVMAVYAALAAPSASARDALGLLLAGAAWHGLISVLWAAALPMLPVRQNLADVYAALGEYLRLKSGLLEPLRDADLEGPRLALALHNGRVVDALNRCEESLLIRTEEGRPPPTWMRHSLRSYLLAQEVHERTSSSHEDYAVLATQFFHSDALYRCQRLLALLGLDCLALADCIRCHGRWRRGVVSAHALEDLQAALRHVEQGAGPGSQRALAALRALAINLGALDQALTSALHPGADSLDARLPDRPPHRLAALWQRLREQLDWRAPLLRHALRLASALLLGYGLMLAVHADHGFWILLTIVFVCQPDYGATRRRLAQRIWGTLLGLLLGWALLRLFPEPLLQAGFIVVAGVLFFASRSSRYTEATAAITALVLLSFNQVGNGFELIVPRLLDTLAGAAIAGLAVLLILPSWQSLRLRSLAAQALAGQAGYLREILAQYRSGKQDHLAYRLARRNAHNADAALSGALSAMRQEPARVRRHEAAGLRFLVLSHTLLNYLSALGAHRCNGLTLDADGPAARAAAQLLLTLEALADTLRRRPGGGAVAAAVPVAGPEVHPEAHPEALPGALLAPLDPVAGPPALPLLQAQLALCLGLLPPLAEQARAL